MNRHTTTFTLALFLLAVCAGYLLTGSASEFDRAVVLELRLPRLLGCLLVGASLALSGLTFQVVLNNVLADAYVLGLSSGASVGALLVTVIFGASISETWGAVVGGGASLILLLFFYRRARQEGGPITLTLWGLTLTLFFTAMTVFLLQTLDPQTHYAASRWFMGSFSVIELRSLIFPALLIVPAAFFLLRKSHHMVALSSGPAACLDLGLSWDRTLTSMVVAATFLAVGAVSVAGPLGFVGLISPHIARLLPPALRSTSDWQQRSLWVGALVVVLCDWCSRTLLWTYSMPTGALTAFIGAPCLALLLWRTARV